MDESPLSDEARMSDQTAFILSTTPEDRRVDAARARLDRARRRTRGTLVAFRSELSEQADWRTWYRARPGVALLSAFFVGLILGSRR